MKIFSLPKQQRVRSTRDQIYRDEMRTRQTSRFSRVRLLGLESLETRYAPAGLALQLDGVDDYAYANDSDSLDLGTLPAKDFTIEASFYVPALPIGNQTLVHKQDAYSLSFNGSATTFRIWTPTTTTHFITVEAPHSPGVGWHHIAAVFDNENSPDRDLLSLYLDGDHIGSSYGIPGIHGLNNSTADLVIGASAGNVPITGQFFAGWIDDVRFSNSVRYSGAFEVPSSPFSADAETAALWDFNEDANSPVGPLFADASGNGNTLRGINGITTGLPPNADVSFVVNSDADWQDIAPGDGRALDAFGRTTLRAAIMEANALPGRYTIRVPGGIYTLTTAGQDDTGALGDLDIANTVSIVGDGADSTIIETIDIDRVFQVLANADATLTKLTIRNGSSSNGGAIYNQGLLKLDNVNLSNNFASWGGAIYNEGTASITNSSIVSNHAYYIGGASYGGGIHNQGSIELNNVNLSNNFASWGGAIYNEGEASIANSSLVSNRATHIGGAIYSYHSNLTILNSTIGENEAGGGGGGLVTEEGGIVTVTNATVYANRAPTAGGIAELNSSIKLRNSIVAGSQAGNNPDLFGTNYTSLGNNLIGNPSDTIAFTNGANGDQVGNSGTPLDPQLGPAGLYNGTTVVYPLLSNSPAIDRGNTVGAPTTDQSGKPRVVDGDGDGTEIIDIGAVEYQFSTFVVDSFSDLQDVTPGDGIAKDSAGNTTLRAAIMEANALPGRYTIRVPGGIYRLTIEGQEETGALGDLDIANPVTIVGESADSTFIESNVFDRVFQVLPNAYARLSQLTIRYGRAFYGGGIQNQGKLELDNVNLSSNYANSGGAIYNEGTASIANSSLSGNHADYFGGAIYSHRSNLAILNSTIGANKSGGTGGGLVSENGGNVTLINTTVYANRAQFAGGVAELGSRIKFKNSIVAGNQASNNSDLLGSGITSLGNNLIGIPSDTSAFINGTYGDQVGSSTNPLDPQLGPAGLYGGSTVVYPLLSNSPAIDRGNNVGAPTTDQSGKTRVLDGDDDGTEIVDIGAVEYQLPTFVVDSFSDFPDVSPGDGVAKDGTGHTTLRAAIMEANSTQTKVRVVIPAGVYSLDISGQEDTGGFGDLDLAKTVSIIGDGADSTIIESRVLDRIFHVLPGAVARVSKLAIRNGNAFDGGAIRNQGTLILEHANLSGNFANSGGAIYNEGTASISNSSLVNNHADHFGGAIYSHSSNLTIINSTIGSNEAGSSGGGGGLVTRDGGTVTVINSTIYANSAPFAGGMAAINSRIQLKNSIVAGNQASNNPDLYGSNYVSLGNNLIGNPGDAHAFINGTNGDLVGSSVSPLDPHLGPAGFYGGSTVVYPILSNSPAIDRGNNSGVPATDQTGNPRVEDGDDDGSFIVDVGAVEYQPPTFVVDSFSDFPDVSPGDGVAKDFEGHTTLRAAIMESNSTQIRVRVRVPAGLYSLAISGQEDRGAYGDLDLAKSVSIIGDGADSTIIESSVFDRVFHVLPGTVARITKLAIRNGNAISGGGVRNEGTLVLDKVSLTGNTANSGGAIYNEGTASVANSSIMDNYVYSVGGAIYNHSANLAILNSTIGENEAGFGGGGGGLVSQDGGSVTVINSTVYANRAPTAGGIAALNSSIQLKNSIVAGNQASNNPDIYGTGFTSLGNNLIGDSSDSIAFINGTNGDQVGSSVSPLDPHLGPVGLYGGSTVVFPILSNSPAIDRGNNVGVPATDQTGNPRIEDGDDDGSSIVDVGAVEYQPPTFVVDSFSDFPDVSPGDGVAEDFEGHTTLRAAIMEANSARINVRVQIPAGLYSLKILGQEDTGAYGDLDLTRTVTIIGDGADSTIIENDFDRVFHILPGAIAKISRLAIRNGNARNGGGILNQGKLVLDSASLTGSTADWGGAIYNEGTASVTNSSIMNNHANSVGGAIYNHSANLTLLNSSIGANDAGIGGGGLVTQDGGIVTVTNSTVYTNRAPTAGGVASLDSSIQLKNSIVAGNQASNNPDIYGTGFTSLGNNLIGDSGDSIAFINGTNGDQVGSSVSPLDPLLGPFGLYGGSTVVFPILSNSPAIDRGNNVGVPATDQTGNPRIEDGDDDGSSIVDVGAVEYQLSNHRPRFISSDTSSISENSTEVLTVKVTDSDVPSQAILFSITGGADRSKFGITTAGVLIFIVTPDYEMPTDADGDNIYLLEVTADDGNGGTATQPLSVRVTPLNDNSPSFTTSATPRVLENTTSVLTVTAIDADLPAQVVTYSITAGADQAKFSLNSDGVLDFVVAPSYTNPTDSNADNVYLIQVTASDGNGGTTVQDLAVNVVDATAPTVVSLSPANDATSAQQTSDLVITFSEPVQKGSGNIVIKRKSDNAVIQTIPVTDAGVTVLGSTVTIDPNDFALGTSYYVDVTPGTFRDLAGNLFVGIDSTRNLDTNLSFYDQGRYLPPRFNDSLMSIGQGQAGWHTFDIASLAGRQLGAVTYRFTQAGTTNSHGFTQLPIAVYDVSTPYDRLSFKRRDSLGTEGNAIALDLRSGRIYGQYAVLPNSNGTVFEVQLNPTALADIQQKANHGERFFSIGLANTTFDAIGYYTALNASLIVSPTLNSRWIFTTTSDSTAPTINTVSPADDAIGVLSNSNLSLTFSEEVQKGAGNVVIKRIADNSVLQSIPVSDTAVTAVTIAGSTVTINPDDFASNTGYYVEISAGAFKDLASNSFPGISGPTTWNFTTAVTNTRYDSVVSSDSPVGYWRVGESGGTQAIDSSANGLHGTYENSVVFGVQGAVSGDPNTALQLGNPNARVRVADSAALRTSLLTLEAIVKVQGAEIWDSVIAKTSAGWNDGYGVHYHPANGGELRFFINNYTNYVAAPIGSNRFVHVAATYDGSAMKLYYDGVQVGSNAFSAVLVHSSQPLYVGWAPGAATFSFNGTVDEVAIYGSALTATQVLRHSQALQAIDATPPTALSFARLNPRTATTTADRLVFLATFSEPVSNVDVLDFAVNSSSTATVVSVAQVGTTSSYEVTVSGGNLATFNGTVGLNLSATNDIKDLAGLALSATEPATDEVYTISNSTSYASVVIGDSPAVYLQLNEASGAVATDSSSNGLHGTYENSVGYGVSGAVPTNANTAIQFGSPNARVAVADNALLRPLTISLEAFVNVQGATTWDTVMAKTSAGWNDGYGIYYHQDNGGELRFFVNSYTNYVAAPIPSNKYVHVVATYDGSTMRMYYDGVPVGTPKATNVAINHSTQPLQIGWAPNVSSYSFNGRIDEVSVFGRALTQTQVQSHHKASMSYGVLVLADAPTAYFRLGESSGTVATDSSVNGQHGSYENGVIYPAPGAIVGDSNTAAQFGSSNARVRVPDNVLLRPSSISLEAIVKVQGAETWDSVLAKTSTGWNNGYGIFYSPSNGGELRFFVNNFTNYVAAPISSNQFVHVAATYDGSSMNLYFDGVQVASKPFSAAIVHSSEPLYVGWAPGSATYSFNGTVDEVAIYSRALSAAAIQLHYSRSAAQKFGFHGTISNVNDVDAYRIALAAPGSIEISLATAVGLSGVVRLFNSDGTQVGSSLFANSGSGPQRLAFSGLATGVYYVGVSSQGNATYVWPRSNGNGGTTTGAYQLRITPNVTVNLDDLTAGVDAVFGLEADDLFSGWL